MTTRTKATQKEGLYVGMPSANEVKGTASDVEPSQNGSHEIYEQEPLVIDHAKKAEAIGLLACGTSVSEAARLVGVNRSTIYRWLSDPELARALKDRREELIEQTFDLQVFASHQATKKLLELLDHDDDRLAFWSARTLAPLKDAYMAMDHERRVRRMEDILDFPA